MSEIENQLPADIDTLHALMVAACAERDAAIAERETAIGERDRALSQIDRLRHLLRQLQRAHFGKRSEKLDPDQLLLTLEDIEQAIAESEAHDDKKDAIAAKVRAEKRRANRGALPRHLPRVDVTIAPEDTNCPCCRTPMHVIGEETSERLDVIPAQFRVIVTHRPKYACRACEEAPVQAPAPERLIKGGLPTEAMVAYVLAAKYAWHLPLYRQAQILLSQGVAIERATLAFWVGYAAAELKPLYLRLRELILGSLKIAVDETVAPVLDPGRGRTKKGYFWAIARDDRPWGGTDPPAIAYTYAPGRGAVHALKLLDTYHGIVQCDGYAAYKNIANAAYLGEAITLAFCWAHLRRKFFEIAKGGSAPIASEALDRIALLYAIEKTIRGRSADERRAVRQEKSKPLVLARATRARLGEVRHRRSHPLRLEPLGRARSLPRRRPHRTRHQHRRERYASHCAQSKERALRRPRSRGGELGSHRLACRDLQIAWRRSASLLRRRAHKTRQSLASLAPRRAHALGLGGAAVHLSPRGVSRERETGSRSLHRKIKLSEQWDRRTAYDEKAEQELKEKDLEARQNYYLSLQEAERKRMRGEI